MLVFIDPQTHQEVHIQPAQVRFDEFCLSLGKMAQYISFESLHTMYYLMLRHQKCHLVLDNHPTCKSSFYKADERDHEWLIVTHFLENDGTNHVKAHLQFRLHCDHVADMFEFALTNLLPPSYEVPSNL